jgi:hypothetical protein
MLNKTSTVNSQSSNVNHKRGKHLSSVVKRQTSVGKRLSVECDQAWLTNRLTQDCDRIPP